MIYNGIISRTSGLAQPKDYFKGVSLKGSFLPDNILVFTRTDGKALSPKKDEVSRHSRFVLICSAKGSGRIGIGQKIHNMEPGRAVLVFPHQMHYYPQVEKNIHWIFITFETQSGIPSETLRDTVRVLDTVSLSLLEKTLDSYAAAGGKSGSGTAVELAFNLRTLICRMAELDAENAGKRSNVDTKASKLIGKIDAFILRNLKDRYGVNDLARQFKLSKNHLSKVFRSSIGMTLGHYMLVKRIHAAAELLKTTDMQVSEIAGECGFDSSFSFGRAFKRETGMTPRQYRTKYRGERG